MGKPDDARSKFEHAARQHIIYGKMHPVWMSRAVVGLAPWNEGTHTLQHAVAIALREAYEAGRRGEEMTEVDFFDAYAEPEPPAAPMRVSRSTPQPEAPTTARMSRSVPATVSRLRRSS